MVPQVSTSDELPPSPVIGQPSSVNLPPGGPGPTISAWGTAEFQQSHDRWNALLASSGADPLFLSWEWLSTWWQCYAVSDACLSVLAAADDTGRLLAAAPLYRCVASIKDVLSFQRLQIIGRAWPGSRMRENTVRSECLDPAIAQRRHPELMTHLAEGIERLDWDELVLPELDCRSPATTTVVDHFLHRGYFVRPLERYRSYLIDARDGFATYLAGLSTGTRRRLYNKRRILESFGTPRLTDLMEGGWAQAVDALNRLHDRRWGRPAFNARQREFHRQVADRLGHQRVNVSCLSIGDQPVSVLYNIRAGRTSYNIQSGFLPDFDRRISPMTLHIGYLVEQASTTPTPCLHLLAGYGKKEDFKVSLATEVVDMIDLQIVRKKPLALLYRAADAVRGHERALRRVEDLRPRPRASTRRAATA
jgi:hypothetical protein